jgi:hypothetical protein
MGDETSAVGSTIYATISNTSGEFPVATGDGNTIFVHGDVAVGDRLPVRIISKKSTNLIGVSEGAEIKLRIDEVSTEGVSMAHPDYGPVRIDAELTENDWYRCRVMTVKEESVKAKALKKIPRRSDIESGPLPESPSQSLNHLINDKHTDS